MDSLLIFVYGAVGGIAPEIIRVRKIVQADKKFSYPQSLLVVSCFVALLGGVMAVALEANTPFNAIWVGVSTPVIISNLIKNPPEQVLKNAKTKKAGPITYDLLESRDASGPMTKSYPAVRESAKKEQDNKKLASRVQKLRDYFGRL